MKPLCRDNREEAAESRGLGCGALTTSTMASFLLTAVLPLAISTFSKNGPLVLAVNAMNPPVPDSQVQESVTHGNSSLICTHDGHHPLGSFHEERKFVFLQDE